ncbi:MAG TPA: signal peptidase II [Phycisphaerae bacterium]
MNRAPEPQAASSRAPLEPALRHRGSVLLLCILTSGGLLLDLWSKRWAFRSLTSHDVLTVIPGVLSFRRSLNAGALFGWGKGWVPLFIVASVVALGFVVYLFASSHRRQRLLHIALALILAGATGNLFDRAFIIADMVPGSVEGERHFIGKVVSDVPGEPLRIGEYPDGGDVRVYPAGTPVHSIGVVRDFIKIDLEIGGREIWPWVFNVADALLVIGVVLLLIEFWVSGRRAARPAVGGEVPS